MIERYTSQLINGLFCFLVIISWHRTFQTLFYCVPHLKATWIFSVSSLFVKLSLSSLHVSVMGKYRLCYNRKVSKTCAAGNFFDDFTL